MIVSRYKGLFNGLGTILLGSVPASAMYWTIYEKVKTTLQEKTQQNPKYFPFCEMLAATLGEIVAASIRNPFEVTKQFIQIRGYSNPVKAIMEISKERGFRSLYSGYSSLLLRDIPFDSMEVVDLHALYSSFSCMRRRSECCFDALYPSSFILIRRDERNCIGTRICLWVS